MSYYSDEFMGGKDFGDFNIKKISKRLNKGQFVQIICEGYGFVAIRKTDEGIIKFALQKPNQEDVIWVTEWELKNQKIIQ